MNILVTGGAGFIGSHTVDALLQKGYRVKILDSLEAPAHVDKIKPDYTPDDAEFILGDVRNKADWEKALNDIEVVFHLAAYQDYKTDFSKFAHVNDVGTALLYEVIVEKKLAIQKVILASSQSVYGEGKYRCKEHGILYPQARSVQQLKAADWEIKCPACKKPMKSVPTDESTVNPGNTYGISKYAQELYAFTLGKRYSIPTIAMRYSITGGPRQSFRNAYSGILRIFTSCLAGGRAPSIYEDGMQLRDYVSIKDVVKANLLVLGKKEADYNVYNVGGDRATTVNEYAKLITAILNSNIEPLRNNQFRLGDTRHMVSYVTKLKALGWVPEVTLETIARSYIKWALEQDGLGDYYSMVETEYIKQGVVRSSAT